MVEYSRNGFSNISLFIELGKGTIIPVQAVEALRVKRG
jgi:hypothetical protein